MRGRGMEWLGGIGRILGFAALWFVFAVMLTALATALGGDVSRTLLSETLVMAVAALAAGALLIRTVDGRSPLALGIAVSRHTPVHVGLGVMIGAGGLLVAVLALLISGTLHYAAQSGTAAAWVGAVAAQAGVFAIAALAEEAIFRGYPFQVLARVGGPVAATIVSSILFALAHGANPSIGIFALVNIFLAGILLAIAYLRTLSLWFATALHMGWNWAMATLFDLPVSGLQVFDTPLYEPSIGGPGWWSGALFGPEGGMVGTLGFTAALLIVLRWRTVRPDPAIVAAGPLVLKSEEESHAG